MTRVMAISKTTANSWDRPARGGSLLDEVRKDNRLTEKRTPTIKENNPREPHRGILRAGGRQTERDVAGPSQTGSCRGFSILASQAGHCLPSLVRRWRTLGEVRRGEDPPRDLGLRRDVLGPKGQLRSPHPPQRSYANAGPPAKRGVQDTQRDAQDDKGAARPLLDDNHV